MTKIQIDGKHLTVKEDINILEAALQNGVYIPHLCHHPDLQELGACRLCIVEVDENEEPLMSCMFLQQYSLFIFGMQKQHFLL